jgi:AraC family transcriptional regulator
MDSDGASAIEMVDVANGNRFPSAPKDSVLISSVAHGWRGIIVEWHRLAPDEMSDHYLIGHRLVVGTNRHPIRYGWKNGDKHRDSVLSPGGFCLQTHGSINAPRWMDTFEFVNFALEPRFVAQVVGDAMASDKIEFETVRCASDATVAQFAAAFRSELATGSPNGPLYADTLTIGFALHLLSNYAVAKPRVPVPRGKLNSYQIRRVVDFILSHLNGNLSLLALAEQAKLSPFHFARQFRATLGLSPHQFVMRQRIQSSLHLIRTGKLPLARIAAETGFHDQAHFTHAFRKILGVTPATYAGDSPQTQQAITVRSFPTPDPTFARSDLCRKNGVTPP